MTNNGMRTLRCAELRQSVPTHCCPRPPSRLSTSSPNPHPQNLWKTPSHDDGLAKTLAARPRANPIKHLKMFSTGSPAEHPQRLWKTRAQRVCLPPRRWSSLRSLQPTPVGGDAKQTRGSVTKNFAARAHINTIRHLSALSTSSPAEHPQPLWTTSRHRRTTARENACFQPFRKRFLHAAASRA